MELFDLVNHKVTFSPQALLLKPFKDLWDRDKSVDKSQALSELGFVFYYSDFKSDFADIVEDEERKNELIKDLGIIPDELVFQACDFYKDRQKTLSSELLRTASMAVNKMSKYYEEVDFQEVHPKTGKLVHDLNKIKTSIDGLGKTIKGLKELEQQVKKEQQETANMKGKVQKKMFEDGFNAM